MNFQKLGQIDDYQKYLDVAFARAKKKADAIRSTARGDNTNKSKTIELARIREVARSLDKNLELILISYPSIDELPEFYIEFVDGKNIA